MTLEEIQCASVILGFCGGVFLLTWGIVTALERAADED
jgi:hypothetical protein